MKGDQGQDRPSWVRFSGIGIEFAAAVVGFTLFGYWIDKRYDSSPWGVLIGVMLGLVGGTYNLVRASISAMKQSERDRSNSKNDREA